MHRLTAATLLLLALATRAAESPGSALAALTYSGDQAALAALDAEIAAAGTDSAKLAALETRLVGVLRRKDTTFAGRQAVCQRLGSLLAVAAPGSGGETLKLLGAMLVDERDSDLARLALEPAPGAAIDALFTGALAKTAGRTRLAILDSIARRGISDGVAPLAALLADKDAATAEAAARALGRVGTTAAEQALRTATAPAAAIRAEARLQAAARLPAADAQRVVRELQADATLPAALRTAAFRLSLDLDRPTAIARINEVLGGSDWDAKQVALEALEGDRAADAIGPIAEKLSTWDAPTQSAVLAALARTGRAEAVPAVAAAAKHLDAEVRSAALAALGFLPGTREIATLLATAVAGSDSDDTRIARQSLARLSGPEVSAAILAGAEKAEAGLRPAYLEQLALRNLTEGLPLLLRCRQESVAAVRAAALGALADLAPASEQRAILEWTLAATDDAEQSRALRALVNVTLRNPAAAERGRAVYAALEEAQPDVALRLLPALARIGGTPSADCAARLAVRGEAKLAEAAASALDRWTDATALPALTTVAEKATLPGVRDQARGAALRQLERQREAWSPATTTVVSRLLATATEAAPRQQLVALLARASDKPALKLAESLRSDAALAVDAAYAAGAINAALAGPPRLRASPSSGVSNILDGKTGTRWSAPALGEEWVEIDFRKSRPLRRLTLDQTGRATEYPEQYEVYVTDDPKTPGPAVLSGRGERNRTVLDFPAGTRGRYVVIKNVAERKDTPWTICELYVD